MDLLTLLIIIIVVALILGAGFSSEAGLPATARLTTKFLETPPGPHFQIDRAVTEALATFWQDVFGYRETLSITHSGKPVLGYVQRTTALDDGRPLHGESGYWRPAPDGGVELVLAHSVGAVGIAVGRWDGDVLRLRSSTVCQR